MNSFTTKIAAVLMGLTAATFAFGQETSQEVRFVVKYKRDMPSASRMRAQSLTTIKERADQKWAVVASNHKMTRRAAFERLARLRADPAVQSAELDHKITPQAFPADAYYSSQWSLQPGNRGTLNWESVWAAGHKGQGAVIAVLDTGLVNHPDVQSNAVAGYDFVSDPTIAGDNNGRDNDPSDEGDVCTFNGGTVSSWHGTRVASIAGGAENSYGMIGIAPQAMLMNVRVLGRCGGWLSDVADAITWVSGGAVSGVPAHGVSAPVVMNLSLATSPGVVCPAYLQAAIDGAVSRGSVIVVAAGNDGQNSVGAPASCTGVVSVAAHNKSGDLASYSNYSSSVSISGPAGGSCKGAPIGGCESTPALAAGVSGANRTNVQFSPTPSYFQGTSAAAPFISGAIAVLKSAFPEYSLAEIKNVLISSGRDFTAGSFCANNAECGFKMVDLQNAYNVLAADYAITVKAVSSATKVVASNQVVLTASASANKMDSVKYVWTQISGPAVELSSQGNVASFIASSQYGNAVFRVTASNGSYSSASAEVSVMFDNNVAPVLAQVAPSVTKSGSKVVLSFNVTDVNNNFASMNLIGAPSGVTIVGNTLEWIPSTSGTYSFKVTAVDDQGLSSNEVSVTISVTGSNTGTDVSVSNNSGSAGKEGGGGGSFGALGFIFMSIAAVYKQLVTRKK